MKTNLCESCHQLKPHTGAAVVGGKYWKQICQRCLVGDIDTISSGGAGFDRRRQYEDNAQDTIQPYDAKGPNLEFARLYPEAAKKIYDPEILEELRKKL